MAPKAAPAKAKEAAAGPLPVLEDEVDWPDGVTSASDPSFLFAIAHVVGHVFNTEGEATEDGSLPPLVELSPSALLVAQLKDPGDDPLARRIISAEREELKALSEGGTLAKGLRRKADAEAGARRRRKVNTFRKRRIAEQQGEELPEGATAEDSSELDFLLLLTDYPENEEELNELSLEGAFGLADAWAAVHLAGETVHEKLGEEDAPPTRSRELCPVPEVVSTFFRQVQEAELGSHLADCTVTTVADCHALAPKADGDASELLDHVRSAISSTMSTEARSRKEFKDWLAEARQIDLPDLYAQKKPLDRCLYEQLFDNVESSRHDVPIFIHCLCEQVARTLGGNVADHEDGPGGGVAVARVEDDDDDDALEQEAFALEQFLDSAHSNLVLGSGASAACDVEAIGHIAPLQRSAAPAFPGMSPLNFSPNSRGPSGSEDEDEDEAEDDLALPFLDRSACRHAGTELPGSVSGIDAIHRIISHIKAPGIQRNGFPEKPPHTLAQRSALRNRIYACMPDLPTVEIERMLLLHEFEGLLNTVQPERTWCLKDRLFHERIPAAVLAQVVLEAYRQESFVDTAYVARHDCLLVALHHRSLPGRVLWHAWGGDLLALTPAADSSQSMATTPTHNDWRRLVASCGMKAPNGLLGLDAREVGYCRTVEQLLVPSDGSVILRTSLRRGVRETFPIPGPGKAPEPPEAAEGELPGLEAPARSDIPQLRVVKDGLVFGIVTDPAWLAIANAFCTAREAKEAEAEAARLAAEAAAAEAAAAEAAEAEAAAAAEAKGKPADKDKLRAGMGLEAPVIDTAEPPEEDEGKASEGRGSQESVPAITAVRLEDLSFGMLWVGFQDGARCTVRMHHERYWYDRGAAYYDTAVSRPGVMVTYTPISGLTVQTFSDGSVRQVSQVDPCASAGGRESLATALHPGGPEDVELSRTVTPFGALVRDLLSGRREMYHADGTICVRNPALRELHERRADPKGLGRGEPAELLDRWIAGVEELFTDGYVEGTSQKTFLARAIGYPGHWRVTRPDGRLYGRIPVPPPRKTKESEPDKTLAEDGTEGKEEDKDALPDKPEGAQDNEELSLETLQDHFSGVLVDGGAILEYEISQSQMDSTHISEQVDPHTGQFVSTSQDGLLYFDNASKTERVAVHADGTRISRRQQREGYSVEIERRCSEKITCHVNLKAYNPNVKLEVGCSDGSVIEVVPQRLNLKGELVPSDPLVFEPADLSTNASVLLRRADGTVVMSRGSGEVDVISRHDITALGGEEEALKSFEKPNVYAAQVDEDHMHMRDKDGNTFDLHGDQSLSFKLSVSMGDDFPTPRCAVPRQPYRHRDANFLPLPEDVPAPRLFVVFGSGEAEELLNTRDALESLAVARGDPTTAVVSEPMGPPMDTCICHSVFRTMAAGTGEPAPITLPPIVEGLGASPTLGPQSLQLQEFVEYRELVEHPEISNERRERFEEDYAKFRKREEELAARHEAYGQGFSLRKSSVEPTDAIPAD